MDAVTVTVYDSELVAAQGKGTFVIVQGRTPAGETVSFAAPRDRVSEAMYDMLIAGQQAVRFLVPVRSIASKGYGENV